MVVSSDSRLSAVHGTFTGIQALAPMAKIAHIYGNGPSRVLYNEYTPKEKDLVVGCNLIEPGINPDIIAVIDSQPIAWMHDNKVFPTARFWVSNRSMLQLRHYEMLDRIKVEKVWDDSLIFGALTPLEAMERLIVCDGH